MRKRNGNGIRITENLKKGQQRHWCWRGEEWSPDPALVPGSGAYPLCYAMGPGEHVPLPGLKRLEHKVDHRPPAIAEVKMSKGVPSSVICLDGLYRENV